MSFRHIHVHVVWSGMMWSGDEVVGSWAEVLWTGDDMVLVIQPTNGYIYLIRF